LASKVKDNKGTALNRRVGLLFERAGFRGLPNSNTTAEYVVELHGKKRDVDLYATVPELGVTIIGSNKSGAIQGGFSSHLSAFKEVADAGNAKAALLIITGHKVDEEDLKAARSSDVFVWTEKELAYYEALTDAVKTFARYEIIHALGITTTEEKTSVNLLALRIRQPSPAATTELYMFAMAPEKLLKSCSIFRRANGSAAAYQRMISKKRLPGITQFISKDESILPTNIVVAFEPEDVAVFELDTPTKQKATTGQTIQLASTHELVVLSVPQSYGAMELLDGQHRLFGFADASSQVRKDFTLAVVGIRGLTREQKQQTFVAINDNSRRMDPSLVAYLQYEKDDSICQKDSKLMAIRVAVDLSERSPFTDAIRLLDFGKQVITLKGVSGYDLKGLVSQRGALRKALPKNLPSEYVAYLSKYFGLVRNQFKDEWKDPSIYMLATNRGVTALLKLLKAILNNVSYASDASAALPYIRALEGFDWDTSHLKKAYVGSQGWKNFYDDLVKQIRKKHSKFRG